jgi:predicted Zn-dependent protease with MMP-like domain
MTTAPQPDWATACAPSNEDIHALALAVRDNLPPPFLDHARKVALVVEDMAGDDLLQEIDIEDPFELSGVYIGTPLVEKSLMDQPQAPDTILLFRAPILDEWAARGTESLGHLVGHVYLHELAHHFGWTDDEIAQVAPWMD